MMSARHVVLYSPVHHMRNCAIMVCTCTFCSSHVLVAVVYSRIQNICIVYIIVIHVHPYDCVVYFNTPAYLAAVPTCARIKILEYFKFQ